MPQEAGKISPMTREELKMYVRKFLSGNPDEIYNDLIKEVSVESESKVKKVCWLSSQTSLPRLHIISSGKHYLIPWYSVGPIVANDIFNHFEINTPLGIFVMNTQESQKDLFLHFKMELVSFVSDDCPDVTITLLSKD